MGEEIKKKRPVVVLNGGHRKHLMLAIVVPITSWRPKLAENPFFVPLEPNPENRLTKKSLVDCFQLRAISHQRFSEKGGRITESEMGAIKKSLSLILDLDPEDCK
jgi:mRNA interferase MazF